MRALWGTPDVRLPRWELYEPIDGEDVLLKEVLARVSGAARIAAFTAEMARLTGTRCEDSHRHQEVPGFPGLHGGSVEGIGPFYATFSDRRGPVVVILAIIAAQRAQGSQSAYHAAMGLAWERLAQLRAKTWT